MTAIAERKLALRESARREPLRAAAGLELLGELPGSGYKKGACLVRRADGQMVQLGPLMFALLECLDGRRSTSDLAACMSDRLGRQLEEEHVLRIAEKLAAKGLVAGAEGNAPPKTNPLLALRWKYLITDPNVTSRLTRPFVPVFKPWIVAPVLIAFLGVMWFVLVEKGVASATAQAFNKPELLLLIFALAVGSAGFHELGHAAACRYGGATPGGMGVGLYMVWPAFYTDVTDSYRLPKRDRLRVDLGGLYFNAVVAVATIALWLLLRVDALLLLVALQLLQMVKQLSPVIRADGYHILSDLTGVPDLYAHMGPTLKRLLPWKRKAPSALTGRARFLVTAWVVVIVPLLIALSIGAVLLFPRLVATAWESGRAYAGDIPGELSQGAVLDAAASLLRIVALVLPVLGVALMSHKIIRSGLGKAAAWSKDRPGRRAALTLVGAGLLCALAWAWWPSGQYRPVRAGDNGTVVSGARLVAAPAAAARPGQQPARLAPGRHLAVAMIPEGGATKERPAFFVIKGDEDQRPVVVADDSVPAPAATGQTAPTPTGEPAQPAPSSASGPGASPTAVPSSSTTTATAFPFKLPAKPGPNGTQALAVNTTDGGVKYTIAYALVTVRDGATVDQANEAYAFASCSACTTVAVSFQVVLVIGQSDVIAPINVAGALNAGCFQCITTAIAQQIVITLSSEPPEELLAQLRDELEKLDALEDLGADTSPEEIAQQVDAIEQAIRDEIASSGLAPQSSAPTPTSTTATPATATTQTQTETTPTATETTPTETSTTETSTTPTTTETTPTRTDTTPTATTTEPTPTETTTSQTTTESTTTGG